MLGPSIINQVSNKDELTFRSDKMIEEVRVKEWTTHVYSCAKLLSYLISNLLPDERHFQDLQLIPLCHRPYIGLNSFEILRPDLVRTMRIRQIKWDFEFLQEREIVVALRVEEIGFETCQDPPNFSAFVGFRNSRVCYARYGWREGGLGGGDMRKAW